MPLTFLSTPLMISLAVLLGSYISIDLWCIFSLEHKNRMQIEMKAVEGPWFLSILTCLFVEKKRHASQLTLQICTGSFHTCYSCTLKICWTCHAQDRVLSRHVFKNGFLWHESHTTELGGANHKGRRARGFHEPVECLKPNGQPTNLALITSI